MKPRVRTEKSLYKPALNFLNAQPGTKAWLHYNSGIWLPEEGRWVRRSGAEDGIPDICGVKRIGRVGQAFCFEVKAPGLLKNLSPAQRRWMEEFERCGGAAFVVDTIEDLMACWNDI